jgi:hypothetical protein
LIKSLLFPKDLRRGLPVKETERVVLALIVILQEERMGNSVNLAEEKTRGGEGIRPGQKSSRMKNLISKTMVKMSGENVVK